MRSLIYGIIGTQERVLVRKGKQMIRIRAIEVLVYCNMVFDLATFFSENCSHALFDTGNSLANCGRDKTFDQAVHADRLIKTNTCGGFLISPRHGSSSGHQAMQYKKSLYCHLIFVAC